MISLEEFKTTILKQDSNYMEKLNSKLRCAGFSGEKLIFATRYITDKNPSLFVDEEFARWACEHNRTWNDSNIFCDSSVNSLSNCCRLKSSIEDLGYFNSIGGSRLKVGSIKVSTLNLARIAYEAKTENRYLNILKERLKYNLQALDVVRDIIRKNVERGLLPNFNDGMLDFEHLYNTIGINGIYETMKSFGYTETDEFGNTKYKPEAFKFGETILKTIREVADEFGIDKDYKINVEQVPGEQAARKFLQADKLLFGKKTVNVDHTYSYNFYEFDINNRHYRIPEIDMFEAKNDAGEVIVTNIKRALEEHLNIDDDVMSKYMC